MAFTMSSRAPLGVSGQGAMTLLLGLSVVIAAIATAQIQDTSVPDDWALPIALTCIVWLGCYLATSYFYFRTVYLLSSTYVISLAVFHLGLLVPYAFGLADVIGWDGDGGRWIRAAGWYTTLAFALFGIGFAFACLRRKRKLRPVPVEQQALLATRNLALLRNLGYGLAFAALLGLVFAILRFGNLLAFTRFELFFRSVDPRWMSLFIYMGPSAAIILVTTARNRTEKLGSYAFGAVMLLILLLSGNRSLALFPLLAATILWVKLGRRIPTPVAAGMVFTVLFAIPVIGMLRTLGSYEDLSVKDFQESRESATVTQAFTEMGSSIGVLGVTLQYVPDKEPYRYFRPLLTYIKQALPNLGASASQEYSRAALLANLRSNPKSSIDLTPADWATLRIIPQDFLMGSGTGFSGVAEPYFNFGYFGVVLWFVALGAFLARLDSIDLRVHYNWLIFSTIFFWHALATVRNEFGVFTKPASLTLVILAIWILVRRFTPFAVTKVRQRREAVSR